MKNKTLEIYIDAQFEGVTDRKLMHLSPGIVKGDGVFETVLCERGRAYYWDEHWRRFQAGMKHFDLSTKMRSEPIREILRVLLKKNKLTGGRIRLMAWRNEDGEHFSVAMIPREPFAKDVYHHGFTLRAYPRQLNQEEDLAQVKSLDYGFFLKAYEYALKHHAQEALICNPAGQMMEGSRSNIFYVQGGKLFTPSLTCGGLAGVTRGVVLRLARQQNLKVMEVESGVDELLSAEEIFLTNALIGIMPVTMFNSHVIGKGAPGRLTKALMKSYKKLSQTHNVFLI